MRAAESGQAGPITPDVRSLGPRPRSLAGILAASPGRLAGRAGQERE